MRTVAGRDDPHGELANGGLGQSAKFLTTVLKDHGVKKGKFWVWRPDLGMYVTSLVFVKVLHGEF
jgi:hypothetical protein